MLGKIQNGVQNIVQKILVLMPFFSQIKPANAFVFKAFTPPPIDFQALTCVRIGKKSEKNTTSLTSFLAKKNKGFVPTIAAGQVLFAFVIYNFHNI